MSTFDIDEAAVTDRLTNVIDPCSAGRGTNLNIVEMGLVRSVDLDGKHVHVDLRLTSPACHMVHYLVDEIEDNVGSLSGVERVTVETDSGFEWTQSMMSEEALEKRERYLRELDRRHGEERTVESYLRDTA